jgi:acyl carrier protein
MLTQESVEKKLRAIVCKVLKKKPEEVELTSRFREDLGADSLDLIVILHEVEEEFDVAVPDQQVPKLTTIGDALRYVSEITAS